MGDQKSSILGGFCHFFGRLSRFMIAFIALVFACAFFISETAHADENASEISISVGQVLSVHLDSDDLQFDIAPTVEGTFVKKTVSASVSTNSAAGYELYMSSTSDKTSLEGTRTSMKITSDFTGTKTSDTMAINTWGYSLDATNFNAIPSKQNQITLQNYSSLPPVANRTVAVNFGVKVDRTLPAGKYSNTMVFSVIAHEQTSTIFDISYMQEMTPQICQATTTPVQYTTTITNVHTTDTSKIPVTTLTDRRDGKTYTVAKFNDGQCWMTDNLALELSKDHPLTSLTSDLHTVAKWTPENGTAYTTGTWPSDVTTAKDRSYYDPDFGVYYNWTAATAGHTTEPVNTTIEDSICPKGWRLPVRQGTRSYNELMAPYFFVYEDDLFSGAMHLQASGYYPFGSGHVDGTPGWTDTAGTSYPNGGQAWLWEATSSEDAAGEAYAFYVGKGNDKYPGKDSARSTIKAHGLSVRCVAR